MDRLHQDCGTSLTSHFPCCRCGQMRAVHCQYLVNWVLLCSMGLLFTCKMHHRGNGWTLQVPQGVFDSSPGLIFARQVSDGQGGLLDYPSVALVSNESGDNTLALTFGTGAHVISLDRWKHSVRYCSGGRCDMGEAATQCKYISKHWQAQLFHVSPMQHAGPQGRCPATHAQPRQDARLGRWAC